MFSLSNAFRPSVDQLGSVRGLSLGVKFQGYVVGHSSLSSAKLKKVLVC